MRLLSVCLLAALMVAAIAGCYGRRSPPSETYVYGGDSSAWKRLGTRKVSGGTDHDRIAVGLRQGAFHKLRLEVTGDPIEMHDVVIVFANGDRFSPQTRLVFGRDSGSRIIDLPGDARVIREILFRYARLHRRGRAEVTVFGS